LFVFDAGAIDRRPLWKIQARKDEQARCSHLWYTRQFHRKWLLFSSRALELTNILQCIIAIYRLSVMPTRVTSLTESKLNRPGEKAAFYIFHILPEWLATVVLFVDNIRKTFGTGLVGDWRIKDETGREKEKRIASEEKRGKTKKVSGKGNGGAAESFEKDKPSGLQA